MHGSDEAQAAVRAVLESYVDACRHGDVLALRAIFHPLAAMHGYLDGKRVLGSPEPFFEAVATNQAPDLSGLAYEVAIGPVQVSGHLATALLQEHGYLGLDFINCFHLLEIEGQWHIVAKLFQSAPMSGGGLIDAG